MAGEMTQAEEEAIEKKKRFQAMTAEEKVVELQSRLKEAKARACDAETELARLKELRKNDEYHKESIIKNLKARLDSAEARIRELEEEYGVSNENENEAE